MLRRFAADYGITKLFDVGKGICHDLLVEKGLVEPGKVAIASDSHILTVGAAGAFATGIGSSELAVTWIRGRLWFRVPETIKVVLSGKLPPLVGGKDVALSLLGILGTDGAAYRALEFHGSGLEYLSMDDRMTVCNMCLEMGAKNAIFPPDSVTVNFLRKKGLPEPGDEVQPDPDASYVRQIDLDMSAIPPMIAKPASPDNVISAEAVSGEKIRIDQAVIGTCTNARISDLRTAARIMVDRKVHPGVRFLVVPATRKIYLKALEEGVIETLVKAGAMVSIPCCGPCGAYGMGALSADEVCITTGSRNFVGRMGAPEARIFLANSATVAASAATGHIVDPRGF
jgi:3-isopropylmalate/(R)-2-methylmalate dehydratase large subunit